MTQEGRKNLEDELFLSENNMRKMVAEAISNASETGGILENAEYESAKNEQSFLEGRISEIKQILSTLSAVPANQSNKKDRKSVEFGSTITLNVWDKNAIQSIEKAIHESGLGLTPTVNGMNIHIKIPPLTQDR